MIATIRYELISHDRQILLTISQYCMQLFNARDILYWIFYIKNVVHNTSLVLTDRAFTKRLEYDKINKTKTK